MASEYFVDENGNIVKVSGTINNAEMLPIESGSATDTKTYIDGDNSKTMSVHSGVPLSIYKQQLVKQGNLIYFNCSMSTSGTIANGTQLLDYPTGYEPTNDQYGSAFCFNDGKSYPFIINSTGVVLFSNASMPISSTFTVNCFWYI